MILQVHVGWLGDFVDLYTRSEKVQNMVDNLAGIKWAIRDSANIDDLQVILKRNKIKFDIYD